ncbi:MAG TPA: toll/interleukin-1 receptor domain-containing protein [Opitutus sp.]|nr:toll/interleukin-1 receptor domain-containing protein [Opitutus sp.]
MNFEGKAVFLSYASQDADAAKRICDSLRQAGVEVWFDQSELRGGDAWDQKIRRQIKECALFVPVISANTDARPEGYFRLEWKLAVDRSHLMSDDHPFLFPVAIDDTPDATARVPDRFRERQWMRLNVRDTPESLAARLKALLAGDSRPVRAEPVDRDEQPRREQRKRRWRLPQYVGMAIGLTAAAYFGLRPIWWSMLKKMETSAAAPAAKAAAVSPARELVERARAIVEQSSLTRAQLDAAEELCDRARQLDNADPLVWATAARIELLYIYPYGYDKSDERRRKARDFATRAASLAPDDMQVRVVQANVFAHAVATPALMAEAEKTFRELLAAHPGDKELTLQLAEVLREEQRFTDAAKLFESIGEFEIAGWSYYQAGELRQALAVVAQARQSVTALQLRAILEQDANEDLDAAQAAIDRIQPSDLLAEMPAAIGIQIAFFRRDSTRMLELAKGLNRDYLDSNAFTGPLSFYTGLAHELAGRPVQAEVEWRAALAVVAARLKAAPDDRLLLLWSAWLHAALHETAEGERIFARSQEVGGLHGNTVDSVNWHFLARLQKREPLLAGLEALLRDRRPGWEGTHAISRFSPEFDFLRGDPQFEKLLRDNLPAGAKPFARD